LLSTRWYEGEMRRWKGDIGENEIKWFILVENVVGSGE
jgi:hypothetical protein